MSIEQQCLECEEKLIGRRDKKFCSDYCRNAYNNRQNSDANSLVRNINNTLRKNRRILEELNPAEKVKISRDILLRQGFNMFFAMNMVTCCLTMTKCLSLSEMLTKFR
jgi:hypothetical protein